jgi:hypothetical protein
MPASVLRWFVLSEDCSHAVAAINFLHRNRYPMAPFDAEFGFRIDMARSCCLRPIGHQMSAPLA